MAKGHVQARGYPDGIAPGEPGSATELDCHGYLRIDGTSVEQRQEEVAALQRRFQAAKKNPNPLHVWRALGICLSRPDGGARDPIPDWCLEYLARAACKVVALGEGKDPRHPGAFHWGADGDLERVDLGRSLDFTNKADRAERNVILADALELAGRRGASAFSRLAKERNDARKAEAEQERIAQGGRKSPPAGVTGGAEMQAYKARQRAKRRGD